MKTDQLMLYREIIAVFSEIHTKTHKCIEGRTQFLNVIPCVSIYNIPRRPRGGVEVYLYSFFNLGTSWDVGGQHQAPATPYPRQRPGTHCIGGWVGPRAGLDRWRKYRPPPGKSWWYIK